MKRLIVFLMVAMLWPGAAAWSQTVFPNVQYFSGRASLPRKIKGSLVLTESELRFNNTKGDSVMVLPLAIVRHVTNSAVRKPASTGRKLLVGFLATTKEELLYVDTRTVDVAEMLVFKCRNGTSPDMVAAIQSQLKPASGAVITDPSGVDLGGGAQASSQDSLSGSAATPYPGDLARREAIMRANRPPGFGRKALGFTGKAALLEGLISLNAAMASGSPLGFGIIFIALSPLAAGSFHTSSKAERIVDISAVESVGVYNLIMATGKHSDEVVFNGNMIAWNTAMLITWAGSKTIFKKYHAPGGGGSGTKGTWSTDLGMVGNGPGLRVAYRF